MADTKLSALALGTAPLFYYGEEGGVSKRYAGDGVFNVKDNYGGLGGATGLGVADDAPAIQAAVDAALAVNISGNELGGIVYFPPGIYKVNTQIICYLPAQEASITFQGAGATATYIVGNVDGWLLCKPDDFGVTIKAIDGIHFSNQSSSSGSGALRLDRATQCVVSRCQLEGRNGAHMGGSDSIYTTPSSISIASPSVITHSAAAGIFRIGQAFQFRNDTIVFTVTGVIVSPTATATYTNNGTTFTVVSYSSGTLIATHLESVSPPTTSGTLVKTGGTGDSSITFTSFVTGLPTPLLDSGVFSTSNTVYYVLGTNWTTTTFEYSDTINGSPINTGGTAHGISRILARNNVFAAIVISCVFNSNTIVGTSGPVGVFCGQVSFYGCTFTAWDTALSTDNVGQVIMGSRFERNFEAVRVGSASCEIHANSFEGNDYSINLISGSALVIQGNDLTGGNNVAGTGPTVCDINISTISGCVIQGNNIGGSCSVAGVDLTNTKEGGVVDSTAVSFIGNNIAMGGGALGVKLPVAIRAADFTWFGNGGPDMVSTAFTFAGLPGQSGVHLTVPLEGMEYDITDCNASTFLATAAGGGTTATAHRRVRYNAALPGWQVVG